MTGPGVPTDRGPGFPEEPAPPSLQSGDLEGLQHGPSEEALSAEEHGSAQGMIPGRSWRRTKVERVSMRVLATGGIIGVATILGAVLVAQDVAGWIVGLSVGLASVILAALLWSSRQL